MKKLLAFDAYLIDLTQEAYLWLWDRTGVYVATLVFAFTVCDHICWGPLGWFDFIFLGVWGIVCSLSYLVQSTDLRRLNDGQRRSRDWKPRPYLYLGCFIFIAESAIELNTWHFVSELCWIVWSRLICIQVRDREPKEFFPSRKLVGAGA